MPGRPRLGFPHLFAGKNSAQVDLNVYPGGSSMAIFIIPIVVYNMYILYIYIYIHQFLHVQCIQICDTVSILSDIIDSNH